MVDFIQMVVSGVAVGSSYALMGLAMVIIYKTSEVPNFAQGEMALATSFITMMLLTAFNYPVWLAFCLALVFAAFLGAFLEFAVLRRAKNPNILGTIVITIGLEMILLGLVSWKFGAEHKTMPFPIGPYDSFIIGDIFIAKLEALTLVSALVLMGLLFFFFRYSRLGLAMKATQQNPQRHRLWASAPTGS
ncbi:MAG: branched-chain amino acid ABC transporter permease [Desulfotignum sp.]|nr:branched-chain amino acid ABC transporter permease [Desulfotignum sp.]